MAVTLLSVAHNRFHFHYKATTFNSLSAQRRAGFWYVLPHNISKRTGFAERNRSGIKESGQLVVYL